MVMDIPIKQRLTVYLLTDEEINLLFRIEEVLEVEKLYDLGSELEELINKSVGTIEVEINASAQIKTLSLIDI